MAGDDYSGGMFQLGFVFDASFRATHFTSYKAQYNCYNCSYLPWLLTMFSVVSQVTSSGRYSRSHLGIAVEGGR